MRKERNTAIVLLLTLILITLVILCFLLASGRLDTVGQSEEEKQTTVMEELEQKEGQKPSEEEEPTEEELIPLFEKAMNEIISLATNPTDEVLRDIFDKEIILPINGLPGSTVNSWTITVRPSQEKPWIGFWIQSLLMWTVSCMLLQAVALPVGRARQSRLRSWMETPIKEHISLTTAPQRVKKKAQLFP